MAESIFTSSHTTATATAAAAVSLLPRGRRFAPLAVHSRHKVQDIASSQALLIDFCRLSPQCIKKYNGSSSVSTQPIEIQQQPP